MLPLTKTTPVGNPAERLMTKSFLTLCAAAALALSTHYAEAAKPAKKTTAKTAAKAPAKAAAAAPAASAAKQPSSGEVLAAASATDWRDVSLDHSLLMELASGPVVIELAAEFAPKHVANIAALARAGYFDNLAIIRVQDNYVTQWGDAEEDPGKVKPKPDTLVKARWSSTAPSRAWPSTSFANRTSGHPRSASSMAGQWRPTPRPAGPG